VSDPEFSQLLTLLYHAVRSSHLRATQCGLLVFSSLSISSSPLTSPILAISPYPLPVTAQPDDPTNPTSLSLAHTAFTQDSGSSPELLTDDEASPTHVEISAREQLTADFQLCAAQAGMSLITITLCEVCFM